MVERSDGYSNFLPSATEVRFFVSWTNEFESSSEGLREWSVGGRGAFGTREIERGGRGRELASVLFSRVCLGSEGERWVWGASNGWGGRWRGAGERWSAWDVSKPVGAKGVSSGWAMERKR